MSVNFEAQNICLLAVKIAQRRPKHAPLEIAKAAGKLYRLAKSIRNRGDVGACAPNAERLAESLGGEFQILSTAEDIECFIKLDDKRERII